MADVDPAVSPPLGQIASGLVGDLQDLLRGELALARVEVSQSARTLAGGLISVLTGALLAFAGLVILLEGGAAILAMWLPDWAALLVVGGLVMLTGGVLARGAFSKLSLKSLTPDRAIDNVRSDARMIKEHAR